jgi:hypothetical protein
MSSNRNIRNPQQLRSLIQNMGRSIDEARSRRLGPSTSGMPAQQVQADARYETQAPQAMSQSRPELPRLGSLGDGPRSPSSSPSSPSLSSSPSSSSPPPVRAASEMFDGGAPRLKARPKRAS